jgi:hypothetical protein
LPDYLVKIAMEQSLKIVLDLLQTAAIVLGALWAYYRIRKERSHEPHIELHIRCNFFGPEENCYLAEFLLIARNKGLVIQKFKSINLRIRAIEEGQSLNYWQGNKPRIEFPIKLIDAEVIHTKKTVHSL